MAKPIVITKTFNTSASNASDAPVKSMTIEATFDMDATAIAEIATKPEIIKVQQKLRADWSRWPDGATVRVNVGAPIERRATSGTAKSYLEGLSDSDREAWLREQGYIS